MGTQGTIGYYNSLNRGSSGVLWGYSGTVGYSRVPRGCLGDNRVLWEHTAGPHVAPARTCGVYIYTYIYVYIYR